MVPRITRSSRLLLYVFGTYRAIVVANSSSLRPLLADIRSASLLLLSNVELRPTTHRACTLNGRNESALAHCALTRLRRALRGRAVISPLKTKCLISLCGCRRTKTDTLGSILVYGGFAANSSSLRPLLADIRSAGFDFGFPGLQRPLSSELIVATRWLCRPPASKPVFRNVSTIFNAWPEPVTRPPSTRIFASL